MLRPVAPGSHPSLSTHHTARPTGPPCARRGCWGRWGCRTAGRGGPGRKRLGQAGAALTDWAVKALRRLVPGVRGLDWASLFFAWFAQLLWLAALAALGGAELSGPLAAALGVLAVVELLKAALCVLIVDV